MKVIRKMSNPINKPGLGCENTCQWNEGRFLPQCYPPFFGAVQLGQRLLLEKRSPLTLPFALCLLFSQPSHSAHEDL